MNIDHSLISAAVENLEEFTSHQIARPNPSKNKIFTQIPRKQRTKQDPSSHSPGAAVRAAGGDGGPVGWRDAAGRRRRGGGGGGRVPSGSGAGWLGGERIKFISTFFLLFNFKITRKERWCVVTYFNIIIIVVRFSEGKIYLEYFFFTKS